MSKKARILIVDDQLQLREFLKFTLKDRYAVTTVGGVQDAFRYMSDCPVNLVLLDLNMPEIDGITALEGIKNRYPDTEVILMTAYAPVEVKQQAMNLGAFAFLIKPFDIDNLISTVDEALKNSGHDDIA